MLNWKIREIREGEYSCLETFLYEAIYVPTGETPPERNIIFEPELQMYIEGFGKKDDFCLVADVAGKPVGAVWCRIMPDYGHIAADIPSLAISVLPEYRGYGIGTQLLRAMLDQLYWKGYRGVSLSVQKENYAYRMYVKTGFQICRETEEEYIMLLRLEEGGKEAGK